MRETKADDDRRYRSDLRERTLDKTLADSFPASDPLSTIPDPSEAESPCPDQKQAA